MCPSPLLPCGPPGRLQCAWLVLRKVAGTPLLCINTCLDLMPGLALPLTQDPDQLVPSVLQMPPLRGLLWLQMLRAGSLRAEAVVLLVGHNSSWSAGPSSPTPGVLPTASIVTGTRTSPLPGVMVSGTVWSRRQVMWGLPSRFAVLLTEPAESSSPFPEARGWGRRGNPLEAGLDSSLVP